MSGLLNAPEREVNSLLSLLATINTVDGQSRCQPVARVAFLEDSRAAFVDFLSCFEIDNPAVTASGDMKFLCLKQNLPEEKLKCISNYCCTNLAINSIIFVCKVSSKSFIAYLT